MPINLLPESYRKRTTLGSIAKRYGFIAGTTLAALLIIGGAFTYKDYRDMSERRDLMKARVADLTLQIAQRAKEHKQLAGTRMRRQVYENLASPLSASAVIEQLTAHKPADLAFTGLTIETASLELPKGTAGKLNASVRAQRETQLLHIGLQGMAKDDGIVAQFVSGLSQSELFTNVKLARTFQVSVGGTKSPAFYITLDVPLNRRFEILDQEMAYGEQ